VSCRHDTELETSKGFEFHSEDTLHECIYNSNHRRRSSRRPADRDCVAAQPPGFPLSRLEPGPNLDSDHPSTHLRPSEVPRKNPVRVRNLRNQIVIASQAAVAATHFRRLAGLLGRGRQWAASGNGLWILPSVGVHTWGMLFAIDVIFLDEALHAIHLQENLRPFRISAIRREARSVLELPAFTISRTGTHAGDPLEIALTVEGDRRQRSLTG
jgi:uncharacterized protein